MWNKNVVLIIRGSPFLGHIANLARVIIKELTLWGLRASNKAFQRVEKQTKQASQISGTKLREKLLDNVAYLFLLLLPFV